MFPMEVTHLFVYLLNLRAYEDNTVISPEVPIAKHNFSLRYCWNPEIAL